MAISTNNGIDYKSYFGQSFWSWQGNKMSFAQSQPIFFFFVALTIFIAIMATVYKTQLRNYYVVNKEIVSKYFLVYGYFALIFMIFRIIILAVGGYPNTWELIPLHFCRFFLLLLILSTILKKAKYIKYFGFLAINGAIFGLLIPDLSNSKYWIEFGGMEIGADTYIFWDFLLTHCFIVLACVFFFIFYAPYYSKKELIGSLMFVFISAAILMGINYGLSFDNIGKNWQSNWWYLSTDKVNGIDDKLRPIVGQLADFPYSFLTFTIIGFSVYLASLYLYFFIDKLDFCFVYAPTESNKKITLIKSARFEIFRNSTVLSRNNLK